jgi:predicted nucleotidyltransferase
MFLYDVVNAFKKHKVEYALVGGFALALHGVVRATVDIDVIIKLTQRNYTLAEVALKELGLTSKIPVNAQDIFKMRDEYIANRNLIAWSFVDYKNPTRLLDIIITDPLSNFDIEKISVGGLKIPVVSLPDLRKLKKRAGRPQDLVDIENIDKKLKEKRK